MEFLPRMIRWVGEGGGMVIIMDEKKANKGGGYAEIMSGECIF